MEQLSSIEDRLVFYDLEVFAYDWIAVFQNFKTNEVAVFHNDVETLREFLSNDMVLCGYNNRHYDQYILKTILAGINPKEMNDFIIVVGQGGWEFPPLRNSFVKIPPQIDLMQDTLGLSLKEIEGNIGWNIKETEVDFKLNRPLYTHEIESTIEYCKADVRVLPKLWELRKGYLEAKTTLCQMSGIPLQDGLGLTNAKLTAKFLGAEKVETPHRRDFDYTKIPKIDWNYIPLEVLEYFDKVQDKSISDYEFETSKLQDYLIAGVPHTIALGGLHGAISNYSTVSDENSVILNYDVASLYPTIVLVFGYVSRCIKDKTLYENVYHNRLNAKKNGDKKTADALKLILNTFYGAMNNQYNDLYDPAYNLATCITGQLLIIELINKLVERVKSFSLVQSNTDGIMFKIDRSEWDTVKEVVKGWEELHSMLMEEDIIDKVVQRDVNNYCILMKDGKPKYKGGNLSDYNPKDEVRWKHNSLEIVAESLIKKMLYDVPIEDTIENCNDLMKFQMIAKTGSTYHKTVRYVNQVFQTSPRGKTTLLTAEHQDVQKVNRIFAGSRTENGAVYKVKHDKDKNGNERTKYDKISNCPLQTLIDGYDEFTIADIDKNWYIALAKERFEEFLGGKKDAKSKERRN